MNHPSETPPAGGETAPQSVVKESRSALMARLRLQNRKTTRQFAEYFRNDSDKATD